MPTIYDVARQAGVSAATVSRAFNSPTLINRETHRHVMTVAKGMNYRPRKARPAAIRAAATGAKQDASVMVGFHFFGAGENDPLQANAFYGNVLAGAVSEASLLGVQLVLSSSRRHDKGAMLASAVGDQELQGAILVGAADTPIVDQVVLQVPHAILVDAHDSAGNCDSILIDNVSGAAEATRYLIGKGHRRIGFILGNETEQSFLERFDGYVSAHFRAGLPVPLDLVIRGQDYMDVPVEQLKACLSGRDRPTALIAANDNFAYAVLQVCYTIGLSVPDDLSLIGFDDLPYSAQCSPPLTTMRVDTMQIGRIAVRRVWQSIARPEETIDAGAGVHIVVPVTLVERNSCRDMAV